MSCRPVSPEPRGKSAGKGKPDMAGSTSGSTPKPPPFKATVPLIAPPPKQQAAPSKPVSESGDSEWTEVADWPKHGGDGWWSSNKGWEDKNWRPKEESDPTKAKKQRKGSNEPGTA